MPQDSLAPWGPEHDALLAAFFDAANDAAAQDALSELIIGCARPLATSILRARMFRARHDTPNDIEDLSSQVVVRLISRLRTLRNVGAGGISDFRGYVATT